MTSKMLARAQYEKVVKELDSEEEGDLEVIDDVGEYDSPPSNTTDKGKGRALADALLADVADAVSGKKRRWTAPDAFDGALSLIYLRSGHRPIAHLSSSLPEYGEETEERTHVAKSSPPGAGTPATSSPASTPQPGEGGLTARKAAKKAKRKAKRKESST